MTPQINQLELEQEYLAATLEAARAIGRALRSNSPRLRLEALSIAERISLGDRP
jgi:hypothetical protein